MFQQVPRGIGKVSGLPRIHQEMCSEARPLRNRVVSSAAALHRWLPRLSPLVSCFAFRAGKLLAQGSFKTSVEEVIIASLILVSGSHFPLSSWSD